MNNKERLSDEFLNAFVDNELTADEKGQVFTRIHEDEVLNRRVCELRKVRDLVQTAFAEVPSAPDRSGASQGARQPVGLKAVAGLVLGIGIVLGWVLHQPKAPELAAAIDAPASAPSRALQKVVLHLNSGDHEVMTEVLDEAENLLRFYAQTNQSARVEIITNGGGLDLLRVGSSPFQDRIRRMYERYDNLVFVACQNSIDRLRKERGFTARLLPEAVVIDSAVAQLMRRQHQGWAYIQV